MATSLGQQPLERLERRPVAGLVGQVGLQRVDATAALFDHAGQACELESQGNALGGAGEQRELALAKLHRVVDAPLLLVEQREPPQQLRVARRGVEHTAEELDRLRPVAAREEQFGRAASQLAGLGCVERQPRPVSQDEHSVLGLPCGHVELHELQKGPLRCAWRRLLP
jgi:hypothetical protein